jgi:hypothetical protein
VAGSGRAARPRIDDPVGIRLGSLATGRIVARIKVGDQGPDQPSPVAAEGVPLEIGAGHARARVLVGVGIVAPIDALESCG